MNITKKQTARILLALSFAGFLGGVDQAFAEKIEIQKNTSPSTITEDVEYETTDGIVNSGKTVDIKGEAEKKEYTASITSTENSKSGSGVLTAGYGTINVSNLKTLNISDTSSKTMSNIILAYGYENAPGKIFISNITNVNVTQNASSGQAIHANNGSISIKDVDAVNITSAADGIVAQRAIEANSSEPTVAIEAKNNITIKATENAVIVSALRNKGKGDAGLSLISKEGEVSLTAENGNAIRSANTAPNMSKYNYTGNTNVTIEGKTGVNITATNGKAIEIIRENTKTWSQDKNDYVDVTDEGSSNFNITSEAGEVVISGTQAVDLKSTSAASIAGVITGGNVELSSTGTTVSLDNAALTLNGKTTISSTSNQAVLIKGNAGQLIIGDDSHQDSTATINGDVYVDANGKADPSSKAFFSGNGTVNFGEGSKLHILGVNTDGKTSYKLYDKDLKIGENNIFASDATDIYGSSWLVNPELKGGEVTFTKGLKDSVRGLTVLDNVLDAAAKNPESTAGKFFEQLTSGTDDAAIAANVNAAANLGELAGLNHGTYTASNLFTDTVGNHLSTLPQDKDLWGYYVHSKESVDGLGLAGAAAKYDTTYDGAVVGMDLYKNGNTAGGVAISYINGSLEGAGIKNDADYYGLSVYGRKDLASFSLVGDVSYLHGSNDITQNLDGKTVTAKPDVDAFTVGVKALKDIALTESSKLTPYVGARYLRINTESYSSSLGLHYDADSQDLLLIPVGVDYSADFKHGAWTYRPTVGVGYVWNAAGRSVDETVSLADKADSFSYNTVDSSSFIAHVGVAAEKENISFGVGYEYQNGSSTSADKWYVNAAYRF